MCIPRRLMDKKKSIDFDFLCYYFILFLSLALLIELF